MCHLNDLRREAKAILAAGRKLQRIIIPRIEFRSAPFSEVIEYLCRQGTRLDDSADPGTRGVEISVRYQKIPPIDPADPPASASPTPQWEAIPGLPTPAPRATPVKFSNDPKVSLTLRQTPLLEALRYADAQANMSLEVAAKGVRIRSYYTNCGVITSVEFLEVPPEMVGLPRGLDATPDPALSGYQFHQIVRDWLAARGVGFPVGASVTYLLASHRLIVVNGQENIDQIKRILTSPPGTNPALFTDP